jgi:hypothetical protein
MTPVLVEAGRNTRSVMELKMKTIKTLKFRHNLALLILNGKKTVTWRLFDDKNLNVGDGLEFIEWESRKKFANVIITNVYEKTLGNIEENDFKGHEKFESKDKMLENYKNFYGDKVTWDTIVKIISFKVL